MIGGERPRPASDVSVGQWLAIAAFAVLWVWGFVSIAYKIGSAAAALFGVDVIAATAGAIAIMLMPFVIVGVAIRRQFAHPAPRHEDTPAEHVERQFWQLMATIMIAWLVIGLVLVAPSLFCESRVGSDCRQLATHPVGLLIMIGSIAGYTAAALLDSALRRAGRAPADATGRRVIYLAVGSLVPPAAAAIWALTN